MTMSQMEALLTCLVNGAAKINLEVQEATVTNLIMLKSRGQQTRKE
jgi:hypothetical protein